MARSIAKPSFNSVIMLPFPDSKDDYFGKLLLKGGQPLSGNITINKSESQIADDLDIVEQVDAIDLEFDAESATVFEGQGELPLSLLNIVYDEDDIEKTLDIVVEEVLEVEDEDEDGKEFKYINLPSEPMDTAARTRGMADRDDEETFFLDINRNDISGSGSRGIFGSGKRFVIRFLKNGIKKALKKAKKKGIKEGLKNKELIRFMISEAAKSDFSKKVFKSHYYISKYNREQRTTDAFPKVKIDQVDPSKKTLILVPGTFTRSFKKNYRKGSFAALMRHYQGRVNWFEHVLINTPYEQIITLDHETVLHSVEDNVKYFADKLNLNGFRFEQPTAMIATSRGGMLAKYLMLFQHPEFAEKSKLDLDLNLNVEKFITVAAGHCGYMEPRSAGRVKRGIEILLSLLNFMTGGFGKSLSWVLSLSVDVLSEMPGLKMQIAESHQSKIIAELAVDGLHALPFANNYQGTNPFRRIIERGIVDKLLGDENDLVLGYASQQLFSPGMLPDGFEVVHGNSKHGKCLAQPTTKEEIIRFLSNTGSPPPANPPVV